MCSAVCGNLGQGAVHVGLVPGFDLFGNVGSTVAATVAAGAAVTVLAPSFAQILDLRGIALVPVAELFLDLVVVWRRGDRSPALHRFLAAADDSST
jgi:hypothetical protein